jgi:cytidylate kinase
MIRVITIAREFGSGGAVIARMLSGRLGWRLLDRELLLEVARAANVDLKVAEQFDERTDPWIHRLVKHSLWHGNVDWPVTPEGREVFDCETVVGVVRRIIEEAARIGNCVIVGRGAQCILRGKPDVFRVFLYARREYRRKRVVQRLGERPKLDELIRESDRQRAEYIERYFSQEWCNPYLYELMINTQFGDDAAVAAILGAAKLGAAAGTETVQAH